jgi:hypothetical protein
LEGFVLQVPEFFGPSLTEQPWGQDMSKIVLHPVWIPSRFLGMRPRGEQKYCGGKVVSRILPVAISFWICSSTTTRYFEWTGDWGGGYV